MCCTVLCCTVLLYCVVFVKNNEPVQIPLQENQFHSTLLSLLSLISYTHMLILIAMLPIIQFISLVLSLYLFLKMKILPVPIQNGQVFVLSSLYSTKKQDNEWLDPTIHPPETTFFNQEKLLQKEQFTRLQRLTSHQQQTPTTNKITQN